MAKIFHEGDIFYGKDIQTAHLAGLDGTRILSETLSPKQQFDKAWDEVIQKEADRLFPVSEQKIIRKNRGTKFD